MGNGLSSSGVSGWGGGGHGSVNVLSEEDVWSYRHNANNAPFVDSINEAVRTIEEDFAGAMADVTSVNAATLGGKDKYSVLGFYSVGDRSVSINTQFTDIDAMNAVMGQTRGYHPPRGSKNGVEAVTLHEMGHALTYTIGQKLGATGFDDAAKRIVHNAYKASGAKGGSHAFAGTISKYAQHNYAETIAEAVADWYCNGSKAAAASKAIMAEMKRIQAL